MNMFRLEISVELTHAVLESKWIKLFSKMIIMGGLFSWWDHHLGKHLFSNIVNWSHELHHQVDLRSFAAAVKSSISPQEVTVRSSPHSTKPYGIINTTSNKNYLNKQHPFFLPSIFFLPRVTKWVFSLYQKLGSSRSFQKYDRRKC